MKSVQSLKAPERRQKMRFKTKSFSFIKVVEPTYNLLGFIATWILSGTKVLDQLTVVGYLSVADQQKLVLILF